MLKLPFSPVICIAYVIVFEIKNPSAISGDSAKNQ